MSKYVALLVITGCMVGAADHCWGQEWGTLKGQFVFDGAAPKPMPITVTKDAEFCGKHSLVSEDLVVDPQSKGIANIVVSLYLSRGSAEPAVHPDYAETAEAEVRIDNENCRFAPHIVPLRTTQILLVGNKDPIGHNTKIDPWAPGNTAINPIIPAGSEQQHRFPAAERRPVSVSCSIHPWMTAWLVVTDHPYVAVSDEEGKFEIANLPAGEWEFQAWQEKVGYVQQVNVGGKATKWTKGRFTHKLKSGVTDLGVIKTKI